jgi:hypothetical protein
MLKQLIKLTILYVLVNVSYCYQKHKMKLIKCVSCPNITVEIQSDNKKQPSQDYNVQYYQEFYSPTLNKDYKNIINQKKVRSQYLKNRERNNFK